VVYCFLDECRAGAPVGVEVLGEYLYRQDHEVQVNVGERTLVHIKKR